MIAFWLGCSRNRWCLLRFPLQDDVVQFLARLGVEEVETPIGAFNELYR